MSEFSIRRRIRPSIVTVGGNRSAQQFHGTSDNRTIPAEYRPIDALTAPTRVLRQHKAKQITQIAASLRQFGFVNPVLITSTGEIIAGVGRWLAAKELGLGQVPVIRVEHLSPEQVRAYRIADNRLAELSSWDNETLKLELGELVTLDLDFEIEVTGFEMAQIDNILLGVSETGEASDAADDVPDVDRDAPAIAQVGDLFLLGEHRLLCGNALDSQCWDQLMGGAKAAMSFQDAPYNVPVNGHVCGLGKVKHREFVMASGEMSEAEFTAFLTTNLELLSAHLIDGGIAALCMDWRHVFELLTAIRHVGLSLLNLCVWNKSNGGMGSLYRSKHELVLIVKKGSAPHINNVQLGKHGRYRTNVWDYAGVNAFGKNRMEDLASHPSVKPVALAADSIRDVTRRGDIVVDSFMGSGTTLLAAERTRRVAYGLELDPHYIDVAIRRWETFTGREATHAETRLSFAELKAARAVAA